MTPKEKIEIFEQYIKKWEEEIFNLELLISTIKSQISIEKLKENLGNIKKGNIKRIKLQANRR